MINIIELKKIPKDINLYKGKFGLFFETNLKKLSDITNYVNRGCQTLTYLGLSKKELVKLMQNNLLGMKVCKYWKFIQMDFTWDGIDLREALTRNVSIS